MSLRSARFLIESDKGNSHVSVYVIPGTEKGPPVNTNLDARTPPRWLERTVSVLIPPTHREQVLGDLAELHRSRGVNANLRHFLADAISVIPGTWHKKDPQVQKLARAGAGNDGPENSIRAHAEEFQMKVWRRNRNYFLINLLTALMSVRNFAAADRLGQQIFWTCLGVIAAFYILETVRFGGSRAVPYGLSAPQLAVFHIGQLQRQQYFLGRSSWSGSVFWIVLFTAGIGSMANPSFPQIAFWLAFCGLLHFLVWLDLQRKSEALRKEEGDFTPPASAAFVPRKIHD